MGPSLSSQRILILYLPPAAWLNAISGQSLVASGPGCELGFNRADDVLEMVEVAIVQATTAGELPHSLDGGEVGAVSGQEVQGKVVGGLFPPRAGQAGGWGTVLFRGGHHPLPRLRAWRGVGPDEQTE